MALVVESGAGLANAESYISVTDADTYFTAHGSPAAWTAATTAAKESALRYAAQWLDRRYSWISGILVLTQALSWPRGLSYDNDGRTVASGTIPQRVKDAQCEAALAHIGSTLAEVRERGGAIESVAAGSVEVVWTSGASSGRTFPYIDSLVAPLVEFGGQRRLVRG